MVLAVAIAVVTALRKLKVKRIYKIQNKTQDFDSAELEVTPEH